MGYSHYWKTHYPLTAVHGGDTVDSARDGIAAIVSLAMERCIVLESYNGSEWHRVVDAFDAVGPEGVCLNGDSSTDLAHESFNLSFHRTIEFGACKTARKPYDQVVTAILIYLGNAYPGYIDVTSDGEARDWLAGAELVAMSDSLRGPLDIPPWVRERH